MKLELQGQEPLILLLVMSVIPVVTICVSVWVFVSLSRPLAPSVEVLPAQITVTPKIEASLPQGAIQIRNEVPAAQIHEVIREVVKVPDIHITNDTRAVEGARKAELSQGKQEILAPVSAPQKGVPRKSEEDTDDFGKRLPDPKK